MKNILERRNKSTADSGWENEFFYKCRGKVHKKQELYSVGKELRKVNNSIQF